MFLHIFNIGSVTEFQFKKYPNEFCVFLMYRDKLSRCEKYNARVIMNIFVINFKVLLVVIISLFDCVVLLLMRPYVYFCSTCGGYFCSST